jgi:hypothetical protein
MPGPEPGKSPLPVIAQKKCPDIWCPKMQDLPGTRFWRPIDGTFHDIYGLKSTIIEI